MIVVEAATVGTICHLTEKIALAINRDFYRDIHDSSLAIAMILMLMRGLMHLLLVMIASLNNRSQ